MSLALWPITCLSHLFVSLVANGQRAALEECFTATKRATAPLMADDCRNCHGREYAPLLTRTEECQDRGVGVRDELYGHDPEPLHTPAGALQPLRRRARRDAAGQDAYPVPGRRSGHNGRNRNRNRNKNKNKDNNALTFFAQLTDCSWLILTCGWCCSANHSALWRQTMARAGEEDNEVDFTAMIQANPSRQAAGTESKMCLASSWADRLSAVSGPQERVLRHTVEQMDDSTPVVPMLEAPVQQLGCSVVGSALGRWEPLTSCSGTASARASCGASPRPGSAGGGQVSHSNAGDGLVRAPVRVLILTWAEALHRVAGVSGGSLCHRSQEQIVAAVVLAVDVLVTVQLEYQQSKFENPEVPQFLFIDRVPDIPVVTQKGTRSAKLCRSPSRFHGCSSSGAWSFRQHRKCWKCRSCSSSASGRAAGTCSCKFQFSVRSLRGCFSPFVRAFSHSVHLDVSPGFQRTFLGSLDD